MPTKRLLVMFGAATLVAAIFLALNATISTHSVCACGTFDESVIIDLNELNAIVRQYEMTHHGLNPTYSELQGLIASDLSLRKKLTPDVDFASKAFTFHITSADAGRIGYAVSSDRRQYVLLGIGLQIKEMRIFGWRSIPIGYRMPVWHPGDKAPAE